MLTIQRLVAIAWLLSATAAIGQERRANGNAPDEAQERAAAGADETIDRQLDQNARVENCAVIAIGERLAPALRQLLDDAARSQTDAYRDVSSLEAVLAQLEAGLETAPGRGACELSAAAVPPAAMPVDQQALPANDPLLLAELAQERDGPYPIGIPFPEEALTCRFYQNAIVDQIVNDANGDPVILLTSVAMTDSYGKRYPNIVHMAAGGYWVRTPIPRTGDGWTHVHVSQDLQHMLLLMDHTQESAGWETSVVVGTDRGRSWRYGQPMRKYVYFDVISFFRISETGSGTAVEHYTGDVGGYEDIGYYLFSTSDWGLTWSDRRYEEELDLSGYVDVLPGRLQRRSAAMPLSQVSLPGFDPC